MKIEKMKNFTENYNSLQGLKILPWLIWLMVLNLFNPIKGDKGIYLLIIFPGILIPLFFWQYIRNHYNKNYGRVNDSSGIKKRYWIYILVAGAVIYITINIDTMAWLPLELTVLAISFFLILWWKVSGKLQVHYLIGAVLLLLFELIRDLIALLTNQYPFRIINVNSLLFAAFICGFFSIFCILDHITLVRLFKQSAGIINEKNV